MAEELGVNFMRLQSVIGQEGSLSIGDYAPRSQLVLEAELMSLEDVPNF